MNAAETAKRRGGLQALINQTRRADQRFCIVISTTFANAFRNALVCRHTLGFACVVLHFAAPDDVALYIDTWSGRGDA